MFFSRSVRSDGVGKTRLIASVLTCVLLCGFLTLEASPVIRPVVIDRAQQEDDFVHARLDRNAYQALKAGSPDQSIEIPLSKTQTVTLELERFDVVTPDAQFLIASASGSVATARPDVLLYRGTVGGDQNSHAYLALSGHGFANGYITLASGETYFLSQAPAEAAKGWEGELVVHHQEGAIDLPDGVEFCGVKLPAGYVAPELGLDLRTIVRGLRLGALAIEGDQMYYQIFNNATAAQGYMLTVIGAVNDIYIRDLKLKLQVKFMRLWPNGNQPFDANDLYGFESYWTSQMDPTPYNLIVMFSGQRDMSYGGVSFVGGTCSSSRTYCITGFLNGSFPNPMVMPSISNWDVIVVAHEMGHALGSYHTHDGYTPPIDQCGSGIPSRGTIMSYCHTFAGGCANTDLFMHRLVEQVIKNDLDAGGCMPSDCNGNDIPDSVDIATGNSDDLNGDGIPDECQDCNGNGVFDAIDIQNGAPDVNGNGVPDACETDCNANLIPDAWEISQGTVPDVNGNDKPDGCDADCDKNGIPDFAEIASGAKEDYDRNNVPDICQDCNGNGISDWKDMQRQRNLYVADQANLIREFHAASGYPIQNLATNQVNNPVDLVFGVDRQLYIASAGNNRIIRLNVDSNTVSTFVPAGSGGLSSPGGLTFGPDGNLYVTSRGTNSVIKYDGATGALIGTFVATGSGGLTQPYGLVFGGPAGDLFVTSSNNTVIEYSGSTGAFVKVLVSSGSGGLNSPRGIAFLGNLLLLVNSFGSHQILEYSLLTGGFVKVFNDVQAPEDPWGICIGPNGHVYVAENSYASDAPRVIEYMNNGRYYRRFVRGSNSGLVHPTAFAFRPQSQFDCNSNGVLDACDLAAGTSQDANGNQIPDECENADFDHDGIPNGSDNCPNIYNPTQQDGDNDAVGDICDNCPTVANHDQLDSNHNGIGDACDYICGDADGSSAVDISDAVRLIAYIFAGGPAPAPLKSGDANCDTTVDISDAVYLIGYIFADGPQPCAGCK
jgi:hypothetical protein